MTRSSHFVLHYVAVASPRCIVCDDDDGNREVTVFPFYSSVVSPPCIVCDDEDVGCRDVTELTFYSALSCRILPAPCRNLSCIRHAPVTIKKYTINQKSQGFQLLLKVRR